MKISRFGAAIAIGAALLASGMGDAHALQESCLVGETPPEDTADGKFAFCRADKSGAQYVVIEGGGGGNLGAVDQGASGSAADGWYIRPGTGANFAQETGGNLASVKTDLDSILAGQATAANQATQLTALGGVTETAPATDTASSGLNGRLQRIAQRITSLISALGSPFQAGGNIGNLPSAAALADGATNPTTAMVGSNQLLWNGSTWDRQASAGATGVAAVGGAAAAGATTAGNPLRMGIDDTSGNIRALIGGADNADGVTVSATTRQAKTQANCYVFNGTSWDRCRSGGVTGMVGVSPQASTTGGYSFLNIAAGQATTTVKSGAGTLHTICLNSAATATNTTTIYDNTAASGTVIGRPAVTTATVPTCLTYDLAFATGLTIITATANGGDMTVTYK